MWIDSHCHLNHKNLAKVGTLDEIVQNAHEAGVDKMLTICCEIHREYEQLKEIAEKYDIWATVGTHPHDAAHVEEMEYTADDIVRFAKHPRIVGIGETGLDYYYDNSPREEQLENFRKHIRAAMEAELPLIIHTRDADEDTIRLLKEEGQGDKRMRGVFHCFSGGMDLAEKGLDLGFYISFSGIVTFDKASELRDVARATPVDKILVETDSPYLAPVPMRGKTNEPRNVIHTGEMVARLKQMSVADFAKQTSDNFYDLFSKAKEVV
ncbi:MAG: TatD family hydrolase [Pseudomonadota bacterium]|jgi:TatD DNase family protein|nr:TatD family hydrolase [Pseudomonadota bacterium]MEE3323417.1 TatD family hydrolase [Pseudomonadota bacterium]